MTTEQKLNKPTTNRAVETVKTEAEVRRRIKKQKKELFLLEQNKKIKKKKEEEKAVVEFVNNDRTEK